MFFAASSVVMAGFTVISIWFVRRIGARRTTAGTLVLLVVVATVNLTVTVNSTGVPSFVFFFVATTLMISLNTVLSPLLTSGALDEVGWAAGTAASTIGFISLMGGALLSPLVDTAIQSTVTPFAAGFLMFSLIAALSVMWADKDRLPADNVA